MTAIFGVVFALSIDYQVFIVSRVREEWLRTGDAAQAVQVGLARTARVVTGAALSMLGVFLAFGLADVASLRQFGVGLAIAVDHRRHARAARPAARRAAPRGRLGLVDAEPQLRGRRRPVPATGWEAPARAGLND